MKTDTSERGLEDLIVSAMTGRASLASIIEDEAALGTGWFLGDPRDYDREYCVDLSHLRTFLEPTQPHISEALELNSDTPTRRQFLSRLLAETSNKGVIH